MKKYMTRQQYDGEGRLIIDVLEGEYDPKDSAIFKESQGGISRWFLAAWVFDTLQEVIQHVAEGLRMDLDHVTRELEFAQRNFDVVDGRRKKLEAGEVIFK